MWKKKIYLDPYLTSHTEISSRWIADINMKCKTIKLSEENAEEQLCTIGVDKDFLNKMGKCYP